MNVSERQHLMSNYAFSLLKIEKREIRLKHCEKREPPFRTFFQIPSQGSPWWSSGSDSVLPRTGGTGLISGLGNYDPTYHS